ncbi:MAG: YkvA family protein [Rhizobiaceae bacterium]
MNKADIEQVIVPLEGNERRKQEDRVRQDFWPKFRSFAARLPFAEDVAAAWFCATDSEVPLRVRGTLIAALAYFIIPLDFVPDVLAFVGMTDDIAVLALAISTLGTNITEKHREQAREALAEVVEAEPAD